MPLAGNFFLYKDMDDARGALVAGKMEWKAKNKRSASRDSFYGDGQ